jgi:hypothetical protein
MAGTPTTVPHSYTAVQSSDEARSGVERNPLNARDWARHIDKRPPLRYKSRRGFQSGSRAA